LADPFLYERVYHYVLEEIRTERLQAGDRVPSEKDLAERFGVSRITTKRALHMLADAGVLDRHRGKGSFVAEHVPPLDELAAGAPARTEEAPKPASSCIALVLPDASDAFGLELLNAIEERAAEHGYHLIVRRTRDSQELEEQAIQALTGDGIADGLIVFPVHGDYYNAGLVRMVFDRSPLVLVDRYLRGIPACAVYTDNHAAAYGLTCHLVDRGHRQVAFVSPPVANTSSIEERSNGFEAALRDRGYAADAGLRFTEFQSTLPGSSDEQEAADRAAIRAFVEREPAATGFVACEYNIALLLREVFEELDQEQAAEDSFDGRSGHSEHGREIACFDSPHTRWARPFVHIKQDQRQMGRRAVDLLLAQLAGEEVPLQTVVPYALIDPFAP
jgi:GntR family transcriptional regulator of arabinose operon